jgi:hypothetical protein
MIPRNIWPRGVLCYHLSRHRINTVFSNSTHDPKKSGCLAYLSLLAQIDREMLDACHQVRLSSSPLVIKSACHQVLRSARDFAVEASRFPTDRNQTRRSSRYSLKYPGQVSRSGLSVRSLSQVSQSGLSVRSLSQVSQSGLSVRSLSQVLAAISLYYPSTLQIFRKCHGSQSVSPQPWSLARLTRH